jgi:hypothetical protein
VILIELPVQFRNVVAFVDVLDAGWHSHREQQAGSPRFLGFAVELRTEFLRTKIGSSFLTSQGNLFLYLVIPFHLHRQSNFKWEDSFE